uniref:Fibronectin type-III domain-containing protein n=1 Tax=Sphaeramia orbicularis TaxID=375764 RepID=A0A672YTN7_9TELE
NYYEKVNPLPSLCPGTQCLDPSLHALDLPWRAELCCDSPTVHLDTEKNSTHRAYTNQSESNLPLQPRCNFSSWTTESHPSGGHCLDMLCRITENWEDLTCELHVGDTFEAGLIKIGLGHNMTKIKRSQTDEPVDNNPVICEAKDSFTCSMALGSTVTWATVVTVIISDVVSPQVVLKVPEKPVKPSPPVNLSHIQTIEAELILTWEVDSELDHGLLRYEVRYSSNPTHPTWQVVSAPGEPRLSLDLKPRLNYTIQVRCSSLVEPPLWSNWSEPHHIYLDTVSYIPEKVVARPGENVTVYCVFNDHSVNASTAIWILNFEKPLHRSQYHPVNQWVSQITMRPSETRMYDLLQCTQEWAIPYSQIYAEGASIDINCETNGDIDAMECSWKNTQLTKPEFRSRWADLSCDVMEAREKAGERVGEWSRPVCRPDRSVQKCTIHPLRMNCYKLWLEVPSHLGPIRSKPVYLSPIDHVKPHPPTDVKAVSSGVLAVSWTPPSLPRPVEGFQCQFRYHSPSTVTAQPEWKVQSPVQVPWAEVSVPDMCRVYVVQVRCMHTSGKGYWSDWSESVYSAPQNSRAPERGPDFWRILQDDSYQNQINVTLLFERLRISEQSYCVDGFVVQRQLLSGSVIRDRIELKSPYSFEWNQEVQTVTVEAYNSLGSSTNNFNMTLDSQPKRRCLRSFRVLVINSTCVSLSWTLLDNSSVPLFMVVQWSPQKQQDPEHHKGQNGDTWVRLQHTERPVYIRGDFFASEEYDFYLYPVFADGEGEPVIARGDPAAYMMLMIISFLSIVLLVTLVLSQNQMKKFVWKDVPNPNKCSWAKGLDFKKADTFDHLFGPQDALPAWPLLLPPENISTVVIVDKSDLSALTTALVQPPTPDPTTAVTVSDLSEFDPEVEQTQSVESEEILLGAPSLTLNAERTTSAPRLDELLPAANDSSAQSSVTYATVLLSGLKQEQSYKDGSGSSSSDEGNFSANNSDISGSFHAGLWELESCRGGEMDDPRRSCSYNSVEELSEEEDEEVRQEKDLDYLRMDCPAEESEDEQREEETKTELLKSVVLNREDCSQPLLCPQDSVDPGEVLSPPSSCGFSLLYLPQFRTVSYTRQLTSYSQESQPQP